MRRQIKEFMTEGCGLPVSEWIIKVFEAIPGMAAFGKSNLSSGSGIRECWFSKEVTDADAPVNAVTRQK